MKWLLMMGGRMKLKPILLLMLLLSGSLSFVPIPVHAAANASGLVGRWAFLEGSGTTTADLSGNGNTGTLTNSPTWSSTGGPFTGTGYLGLASNQYVDVSNSVSLNPTTLSIVAWVKLTTVSSFETIVVKPSAFTWTSPYATYGLREANGNIWEFWANSYSTGTVQSISAASTSWTFLVGTYDGSNMKIYVNGNLENTVAKSGNNPSSTFDLAIGTHNVLNNGEFLNGNLAFLGIYNRALSASEISNLYKNGVYTLSAPGAAWDGITVMCDISCSSVGFNTQGGGSTGAYPFLTFNTEFTGTEVVYMPKNMFASGVLTGIAGVTNNNVANTASYTVGVSGYQFTASTGILIETGASTHEIDFQPGPNCNFCATGISINGQTTTTANPGGTGPPPVLGGGIAIALALGAGVYIFMRRRSSEG